MKETMKKSKVSRELKNLQPCEEDSLYDVHSPFPGCLQEEIVYGCSQEDFVYPERDYTEAYHIQNLECAQIALDYYNKKNRTNYELVEATESNAFDCAPVWIHLNFTAKPKETSDGDGSASTKLFFAELELGCVKLQWFVTACLILKGKSCCCDFCHDDSVKHPTHGYRMRQKFFKRYDLRPRARAFKNISTAVK